MDKDRFLINEAIMTKKTRNRLIIIIGGGVLVIGGFFTHKILTWDEPPFDDSDLAVEYLDVPDDENALTYFNEAARLLDANGKEYDDFLDQLYPTMKVYDPEFSEGFLQKNHKAFKTFKKGLECKHCQAPRIVSPFPSLDLKRLRRQMARALSVRAMHFQEQGNEEEAVEAAMDIVEFGYMLENSRGSFIDHTAAAATKSIGLSRLRKTIAVADIGPDLLKRCIQEMEHYKSNEEGLVNAMKAEYAQICVEIDLLLTASPANPFASMKYRYGFKPNATKRLYAEMFRFYIEKISEPWPETAKIDADPHMDMTAYYRRTQYPLRLNEIGIALSELTEPILKYTIRDKFERKVDVSATQILFALKCYKLEYGDLPETLDKLVPEYINEIPIDDFDGKHLRYSKEKKIIYSVGPDMEDSGGKRQRKPVTDPSETVFWLHDDQAFKIDF